MSQNQRVKPEDTSLTLFQLSMGWRGISTRQLYRTLQDKIYNGKKCREMKVSVWGELWGKIKGVAV